MIIGILSSTSAMATFDIQKMQQVEALAVADFAKENSSHVEHLTGWKTWKSGDDVKVKIYVDHDGMNMEYNYNCHEHGDGKLQCHVLE